jgi:predicted metal-dependent peptidase
MGVEFPLYFDDADLVGPLPLDELDRPIGGGGTSFIPFFQEVAERGYERVVYFTDLCGAFPDRTDADVLWVVPPGVTDTPPFGRVVKILD